MIFIIADVCVCVCMCVCVCVCVCLHTQTLACVQRCACVRAHFGRMCAPCETFRKDKPLQKIPIRFCVLLCARESLRPCASASVCQCAAAHLRSGNTSPSSPPGLPLLRDPY
jgi:hypothetical protein